MRRPLRVALHVLASLACVMGTALAAYPDSAGAPLDQYENFDRTDPILTDAKTRLVWARVVSTQVAFAGTSNACLQRGELGAGRRLPTVKELLTLVDEFPHERYEGGRVVSKFIDPQAFSGSTYVTPVDFPYWTSTSAGSGRYWTVDFATGEVVARAATDLGHVRCVRQ